MKLEGAEPLSDEEYKIWLAGEKEKYDWDEEHGFMHYAPYDGGSKYKEFETITVKPSFKVWVDGGVIDYAREVCIAKHLDCSATCCHQSYCAPTMAQCTTYLRRSYTEVYIGIFVVTMIVAGIPTCILFVEFLLNFKFCSKFDEEAETQLGGMTICEAISFVCTCGQSNKAPTAIQDDYIMSVAKKFEDELAQLEMKKYEQQIAPPPSTYNSARGGNKNMDLER